MYAANYLVPGNPEVWNHNWLTRTLPKIDVFTWTLLHLRLLTGENLERRGIAGPFRCPLCVVNTETITNLFFNCPYSVSIWNEVIITKDDGFSWTGNNQDFFIHWDRMYKGELGGKNDVRACWQKLPKIVCWCIWLERNQRIFQNKSQPAWQVSVKIKALLGEVVRNTKIPPNKAELSEQEKLWTQSFKIQEKNSKVIKKLENWEIRLDNSQFENWLKERKLFKLFFDGASKGNPGEAGGRGVVLNPTGKVEIEYSWNIGHETNNMAEAYGLWQGLKQVQKVGAEEVVVIGDSRIIIQAMRGGRRGKNERMERLLKRIRDTVNRFRKIKFYHVLKELNKKADKAANNFINLECFEIKVNSMIKLEIPP